MSLPPSENASKTAPGTAPDTAAEAIAPTVAERRLRYSRMTVAVGLLAVIALVAALYLARAFFVPLLIGILGSYTLRPLVDWMQLRYIPRPVGAAVVLLAVIGSLSWVGYALSDDAAAMIERLPEAARKLRQTMSVSRESGKTPLQNMQEAANEIQGAATDAALKPGTRAAVVRAPEPAPWMRDYLIAQSGQLVAVVSQAPIVLLLTYFLLASGDVFLRKLVTVIPSFRDKKRAVEITRQIETDISFYLLNFTLMNVGLGIIMAVTTSYLGLPNPLLWGALAAVLKFVPYVGAITSMAILAMAGIQTFDNLPQALAAPGILVVLLIISAAVIAPAVLGRRLLLNPVAIFISILLWGWLWGIVGVLLAVPLLATFKIVCERVEPLHPIAEFLTI